MLIFRLRITNKQEQELEKKLKVNQKLGKIRESKQIMAVLAISRGVGVKEVAEVLQITEEIITKYVRNYLVRGIESIKKGKSTGRPGKLNKKQKEELAEIIEKGPQEAGFSGGCWRSPMIAELVKKKYGVKYSVFYIAELLKNMGFSFQKARFVSDHLDEEKRAKWLAENWPKIFNLARNKGAYLLFGDEVSFPQWGSLSYTWSRRGKQPIVKTSGVRKSFRVFGLIDYFTGKFFYQSTTLHFNSDTYESFLTDVMARTQKHIILVQDGAKYHTSKQIKDFFEKNKLRLTVFQLPTYSPDFNPIEKLWKNVKKSHIHLHHFPSFDSLQSKVNTALFDFSNQPFAILALFGFYDSINFSLPLAA
jgi:transposase